FPRSRGEGRERPSPDRPAPPESEAASARRRGFSSERSCRGGRGAGWCARGKETRSSGGPSPEAPAAPVSSRSCPLPLPPPERDPPPGGNPGPGGKESSRERIFRVPTPLGLRLDDSIHSF